MERAYATLEIKSFDPERRIIEGFASTPEADRQGDIMEPAGAVFEPDLPLLLFHDQKRPVGRAKLNRPTPQGIAFTAHIPEVTDPGVLKDRVDEAWHSLKAGLLRGTSIGWNPLPDGTVHLKDGRKRRTAYEILELSLVTVPANRTATITAIKSICGADPAASGSSDRSVVESAGVSASVTSGQKDAHRMSTPRTYPEQIQDLSNQRAAHAASMEAIQAKAAGEGRGKDEAERQEFDSLKVKIKSIDDEITDLRDLEKIAIAKAVPVNGDTQHKATETRNGNNVVMLSKSYPKGTLFTRVAMAIASGRGSMSDTIAFAKRWEYDTPEVLAYVRKAVEGTAAGVDSPAWGGQLALVNTIESEFVELLRAETVLGKISGFRTAPFNVRIVRQIGGSTVNWVGEAAPKPVTELDFDTINTGYSKIAGIVVLTDELVRLSKPDAEATVRQDLIEQISRFIDVQFLDPTVAATANNPASITNGVASPAASGDDADALYTDLNTALATFDSANMGTQSVHIIMPPALARGIAAMRGALGQFEFPSMSVMGGTLMGFPVIVSSSVPAGTIVILKASEIFLSDDGRVTLDASNQATLDMAGGSSPTFSLWQNNCTGIRAERWITWTKRRADAVAVIDSATYGPTAGSPG